MRMIEKIIYPRDTLKIIEILQDDVLTNGIYHKLRIQHAQFMIYPSKHWNTQYDHNRPKGEVLLRHFVYSSWEKKNDNR